MRVAYSDDQGRTWTEVDSTANGALTVSATDADVWVSNGGLPLRLNGSRWETPSYIPAGTALGNGFIAVGDGITHRRLPPVPNLPKTGHHVPGRPA